MSAKFSSGSCNTEGTTPADQGRKRDAGVRNEGTNLQKKPRGQEERTEENKTSIGTIKDCEKNYGDHVGITKSIPAEKSGCQKDHIISGPCTSTSQTPRDNTIKVAAAGVPSNTNLAKTLKIQEESTLCPADQEICEVYVYTRPVGPLGLSSQSSDGFQTCNQDSSPSILGWVAKKFVPAKHWCAAFDYGGDKVVVCQALENNKNLVGECKLMDKKELLKNIEGQYHFGKLKVSMTDVQQAVDQLAIGGDYNITENNCQTWVIRLFEKLKLPIPTSFLGLLTAHSARKLVSRAFEYLTN